MNIEVGQIRRWTITSTERKSGSCFEVKSIDIQTETVYYICENGEVLSCYSGYVQDNSELVPLDNIRDGEWVECLDDCTTTCFLRYKKGKKYKVGTTPDNCLGAINGNDNSKWHYLKNWERKFKPCLPPIQDKKRTYSNAEIMQMMEEGRYIVGDEIENQSGLVVRIANNLSGEIGFYLPHGYVCFTKDSMWTINKKEVWEKIHLEEAMKCLQSKTHDVKCSVNGLDSGQTDEFYNKENELPTVIPVFQILHGTWYKKVKRD